MVWEEIVNNNSNAKKHSEHHARKKKYIHRATIASLVSLAFILTAFANLVHPFLGETGMVISLCVAWYNIGRLKESA